MKTAIILQDCDGYPERLRALQDAHPNVIAVCPPDKAHLHATAIEIPAEWIPADQSIPFARRCWHRAHALGMAAVQQLDIDADFYWFIESDCVASQARWKAIFADHAETTSDCVSNPFRSRLSTPTNPWWSHPGTPAWATHFVIPACYRLSRRAVEELIRTAEETRECFCEHAIASTILRAGFTHLSVNARQTHWNSQTFRTTASAVIPNPLYLMHPVKTDTYGP
jgi:hypothetical protein